MEELVKGVYQILSILDIRRRVKTYLFMTIFVMLFGIIYEMFSHGVYSNYMIFAFLIPLIFGVLIFKLIEIFKVKISLISVSFYNLAIISLTIGCIIKGFLDIYGTTNDLIYIYLISSGILLSISLITIKYKI